MAGFDVPTWSGEFMEQIEEGRGYMAVHVADVRQHRAPAGWDLVSIEEYEDSEVFVYRKAVVATQEVA